jgi:zinc protease
MNKIKNILVAFLAVLAIANVSSAQTKPAAFKVPAYQKFTLPNGLTVYLMEQHEVPTISWSSMKFQQLVYQR